MNQVGGGISSVNQTQRKTAQQATNNAKKTRFGALNSGGVRHNQNPLEKPKTAMPNMGGMKTTPGTTKASAQPNNIEATDTAKEVLQDISEKKQTKDGENNGK